jgi:cellulose synthase/poly-beta-1,6-N-acetylglucosamine synthase-like glycosyltransferase
MFDILLLIVSCIVAILYAIIVVVLTGGFRRLYHSAADQQQKFSIVVAARNEERHIAALLDSLLQLDYPKDLFEIIIVNDRSTDATHKILDEYLHRTENMSVVTITDNTSDMPHKKNALRHGIAVSRNDVLAFTDADCIVPPGWLRELSKQFTDSVGAVAGYSPYRFGQIHWANWFLRYEEYKNSLLAAAAIGLGRAYMCTGRNFAYRKKVYDEVGGFEKIKHSVSGDDDLFLQLVRTTTQWEIRYMTASESFVETRPPESLSQFIHQRTRHISASKYYVIDSTTAYSISHLFLFLIILLLFVVPVAGLIFLLFRMNLDAIFIAHGSRVIFSQVRVTEFVLNEIALALYTIIIGPFGFFKQFKWKDSTS